MRHAALFVLALAFALGQKPLAASAGELDLTSDLSGFTSPDDVYGPWRSLTGTYRWVAGSDTPSVSLVDRSDADRLGPTHSLGLTLDDYHDWSARTFTYAAVGVSSGDVLPTRSCYIEGDQKLGRSLGTVVGAGFGIVVNPDGVIQRYVNVGPAFYFNGFNMSIRYLQTFTTRRTGSGTVIAVVEAGRTGKTLTTLTLLAGDQPPNGIVSSTQPTLVGQRTVLASLGVKHWIGSAGGFTAAIEIERLNDRATGNLIYVRRAISIGVFHNVGPALP